jgi:threonyl-tRNA synthetase
MFDSHDHRKIAKDLDLFHMQPEAPGMVFWHPRGFAVFRALEEAIRREMRRQHLHEVRSPQLLRQQVWEASGHWDHFREGMFHVEEDRAAALKPVSCPAHLYIAKAARISYRDLPIRLGEIGIVHRNEKSGNLHGLFRLRQFSQDDGHIICAPEHVVAEVVRFCKRLRSFYAVFDLHDIEVAF